MPSEMCAAISVLHSGRHVHAALVATNGPEMGMVVGTFVIHHGTVRKLSLGPTLIMGTGTSLPVALDMLSMPIDLYRKAYGDTHSYF